MERVVRRVDKALDELNTLAVDLDVLEERDERFSVGIENFNAYNDQFNLKLTTVQLKHSTDLEVGREDLKSIINNLKDKIKNIIRKVKNAIGAMMNKYTSFTSMMVKNLDALEGEINGDVVFNSENTREYNKLNDMNYLHNPDIEDSMLNNIDNVRTSYVDTIDPFLKFLDKMVEDHITFLDIVHNAKGAGLILLEYRFMIKEIKSITSDRHRTSLLTLIEKKFKGRRTEFIHYTTFRTSKHIRLMMLDFKKCKRDKKSNDVCEKLQILDADASILPDRAVKNGTVTADQLRYIIKMAIKSMSEYDPIDVEKSIRGSIEHIEEKISETKSTKRRTISNLGVVIKYYGAFMKHLTSTIFDQHKMNFRSIRYLVHLSGD